MANTYTLINSNVLASSAASVTFSAIPATFTDLVIRASIRTDRAAVEDWLYIKFNGLTTNRSYTRLTGSGSAAASGRSTSVIVLGETNAAKFTPIEQVTKEQVIAWVKKALGSRVTEFENRVIEQIERQRVPQPKSITLPWMSTNEPEQALLD